jgi:hypothetical protein
LDIRDYGAVDGEDCTEAFEAAIVAVAAFGAGARPSIYVPAGTWIITHTINYFVPAPVHGVEGGFVFIGEGYGSHILANFAGFMFENPDEGGTPAGPFIWEKLNIGNQHVDGCCLKLEWGVTFVVRDCLFGARKIGIWTSVAFGSSIENCIFRTFGNTGIGVLSGGHCRIHQCQFNGWRVAVMAYQQQILVDTCRIEVCNVGVSLGSNDVDVFYPLNGGVVSNNTFEANDVAIETGSVANISILGNVVLGTPNAPAGNSIHGLKIRYAVSTTVQATTCTGNFTGGTFHLRSDGGLGNCTFISCQMYNNVPGVPTWDIDGPVSTTTWIPTMPTPTDDTPVNTVAPTLSPTSVTVGATITCSNGTWTGLSVIFGTNLYYQWMRNGVVIATSQVLMPDPITYVTVPADAGTTITCKVAAQNYGTSAYVTSSNSCTVT